jgi:hypothetical protein
MSLHAQLSPEALEKLQAQKRNSTISSLVIAFLTIVLIGLLLGVFLLPEWIRETPTIVTYAASLDDENKLEQKKVTNTLQKKPSSPASAMAKVIAANTTSPTAVPVPDVEVTTPSTDFGDSDDFGAGWGDGSDMGDGGGFANVPAVMRKRCSKEDRLDRLAQTGGTPACEDAVEKGLEWLKASQNSDGSWTNQNVYGMTGLALLSYLGRCETPLSSKYGESCLRAITWLVDRGMKQNGQLATNFASQSGPYEHAIATYAIAEAATFCKQLNINVPNLMEVTQKAGQLIIDNQNSNGGWAYNYANSGGHTDLSVVAWQIQALKACYHTGIEFKGLTRSANRGLEYAEKMQNANGGFGYNSPNTQHGGGYFSLTGAGVLSLQMWGKGNQSAARKGARYIEKESKFDYKTENADLYGHYYEAQAMINRGGQQWKKYNDMFRDQLLKNQASDGSWTQPGANGKVRAAGAQYVQNVHYRTCLAILMLEVYYRFLPGTGGIN